jgi:hypothetical protein
MLSLSFFYHHYQFSSHCIVSCSAQLNKMDIVVLRVVGEKAHLKVFEHLLYDRVHNKYAASSVLRKIG